MALMPALAQAIAGELTDAQCAAAMWLLNAHLCGRLLTRSDADRVLVMNGQDVISDPQRAVLTVGEHFGLADDDARAELAKLRPATSHAKHRGMAYDRVRWLSISPLRRAGMPGRWRPEQLGRARCARSWRGMTGCTG